MKALAPILAVLLLAGCGSQAANISEVKAQGQDAEIVFSDGSHVIVNLYGADSCSIEFTDSSYIEGAVTLYVQRFC